MLLETGSRLQGIHLYDKLLKAEKVPVQMQEGKVGPGTVMDPSGMELA